MENFTEDENITKTLNPEASTLPAGIAVFLSVLNIFISITASLGNALILIALRKVSSLHPPSKLLFRCLAVTDLCVGLISQPLFATIRLNAVTKMNMDILSYVVQVTSDSSFVLCEVSIFTSTAISVDRLLALLLGLRYSRVVTLTRVRAVIASFCLISVPCALMHLFCGITIALSVAVTSASLSLVISIFSYTNIFLRLRRHQAQVQGNVHQGQPNGGGIPLNIARYRKTVYSIAWVQLALVSCYVPYIIYVIIIRTYVLSVASEDIILKCTRTLVYLNSTLNPFLYCWRMGEVRQAVKDTLRQFFCFSN